MKTLSLIVLLCIIPACLNAQNTGRGFPQYGSMQNSNLDAINLQNLNAHVEIPVVTIPGRGMDFTYSLVYDSQVWTYHAGAPASWYYTSGWQSVNVVGSTTYSTTTDDCVTGGGGKGGGIDHYSTHYYGYAYVDPSGTKHYFNVSFNNIATTCGFSTGPRTGYATDGSGYYLNAGGINGIVIEPGGKIVASSVQKTDTNGNEISASVAGSVTTWTDTRGSNVLIVDQSSNPVLYKYQDTTGAYQQIKVTNASFNIKSNFACANVVDTGVSTTLPTRIDLPNGQFYTLSYEPTPNMSGFYTGRLQRLTMPNGGYIEYDYTGANDGVNCSDGTTMGLNRVVNDGTTSNTWSYARTASPRTTTITAPQLPYDTSANQTVLTFDAVGNETIRKIYQGSATGGTLLRTINTTWASEVSPATRTTILEDGTTQSEVETTYDLYGNLVSLKEHDWGTGAPGAVVRTTTTAFLNTSAYIAANIVNRPTSATVADSTGTVKSRTDIAYDESGYINFACPLGVAQHNDTSYGCTFTTRGNPTTTTTYTDPVTPAGAIAKHSYYDFFGNLVKADLNCCQQKTWLYSASTTYAFPDSVTSGSSSPTLTKSATYNPYTGLIVTSTDENGQQTSFDYTDPGHLNRLITMTRPDSAQVTYSYDDTNHTIQVTSPVQGTSVTRQKTFTDGLGRTIKQQLLDASNASYSITETQYDTWGRPYKTSNPHNSTAQYWTESRTDAVGRVVKTILPDNSQTAASYSLNTVITSDPAAKQRKSVTDALGRLAKLFEPDVTNSNALTVETDYSYTVLDTLSGVVQGGQARTFLYDALGRMTDSTTPEAGHFQFQYNNYNLLTQRTDTRGVITTYGYDSLNRLYTVTYNVGSTGVASPGNVTYTYGTNSTQNNNGRLITITDGVGPENYSYSTLGQVSQVQKTIGTITYSTQYAYNLGGGLTSITYPSGRIVQQSFDAIGRLCAVGASGSTCSTGTTYATGFNYNTAFQVTALNYGNGVSAAFGFSQDRLQLTSLAYSKGASTLFSLNYSYGATGSNNGQIASITDNVDGGRTATYTFDGLNRLTNATTTGSANYPKWGLSMAYDRLGNRYQQTTSSGCVLPMTCPTNSVTIDGNTNRIFGSPYVYDLNGNMTNDGANTLAYDTENHVVSSTGSLGSGAYTYDGKGLRVKKVSGSITTVYIFSGNKVIAEYENGVAPASPTREYIYSGAALLAKIDSSGTKYYHQDHLSNRLVTDSNGNKVTEMGHFPFGESWYNATSDKLLFTSYERDSESGNDFAMARYNISRLGRFSTPDPLGGNVANPQSLNRYAYALNNPSNVIDPLGLHWECVSVGFNGVKGDPACNWVDDGSDFGGGVGSGGAGAGGGGGNGGGDDGAGGTQQPKKPECFAQLKTRSVDDKRAKFFGATHSFWYVQDSTGSQYTISAGPVDDANKQQYLNVWVTEGTDGQLPLDKHTAKTTFDSGVSPDNCAGVDKLVQAAWDWPNFPNGFDDQIPYQPQGQKAPNSNSAANYLGQVGGFSPSKPSGAYGWGKAVPIH